MSKGTLLVAMGLAALLLRSGTAWGIGFVLGETREELKLEYDVAVQDHGTGRVTVVLTLIDEGRLGPLDVVELAIPGQEKNKDGGRWMDLVVPIDMTEAEGGKRVGRVHLLKEWAERAEIRLNTHTLDGKRDPLTRLHHVIPVAAFLKASPATEPAVAPPAAGEDRTRTEHRPVLDREGTQAIVAAANLALRTHLKADKKRKTPDDIPAASWGDAIAALKPIRVRNDRANVAIVLSETDGLERGLYVSVPISSYAPRVGDRFTVLEKLGAGDDRSPGELYRYELRKQAD